MLSEKDAHAFRSRKVKYKKYSRGGRRYQLLDTLYESNSNGKTVKNPLGFTGPSVWRGP